MIRKDSMKLLVLLLVTVAAPATLLGQIPAGDSLLNFVEWPRSEGGNGHWYAVLPEQLTWQEADSMLYRFEFDSLPLTMATVTSEAENQFIVENVIRGLIQPGLFDMYWTGGMYLDTEWVWTTNEYFPTYTNWAPGQPVTPWIYSALAMWGSDSSKAYGPAGTWWSALKHDTTREQTGWAILEYGFPEEDPTPRLVNLTQWRVEDGGNDHWYAVMTGEATWYAASHAARRFEVDGFEGSLATVSSSEENTFIHELVLFGGAPPSPEPVFEMWLGGYLTFFGEWRWLGREPWDYTNWLPGVEPNNLEVEDHVAMIFHKMDMPPFVSGYWNSADGDEATRMAVVEFGPSWTPGPDLLVHMTKWESAAGGNDHWYAILPTAVDWSKANWIAEHFDVNHQLGHLATIASSEENQFVLGLYNGWVETDDCNSVWLGGDGMHPPWNWVTGEPFEYTNWVPWVVPDTLPGGKAIRMDGPSPICDFILPGGWRALETHFSAPAIVEFDTHTGPFDTLINLVQWNDFAGGNGHWYGILPKEMYWDDVNAIAHTFEVDGMTGYLATVTSALENDFILNRVINGLESPSILDEYFLGGRDMQGRWGWITNETWGYTNWADGEPNNTGIETALAMWGPTIGPSYGNPGEWNNCLPNDSENPLHQFWSVIEFGPADPHQDTLVNIVKWSASQGGNDHWYAIMPGPMTWYEADYVARDYVVDGYHGHLASIHSLAENMFITQAVLHDASPPDIIHFKPLYWLGGTADSAFWSWISGEPWTFDQWAAQANPDNPGPATSLAIAGPGWDINPPLPGEWLNVVPHDSMAVIAAVVEFGPPIGVEPDTLIHLRQWSAAHGGNDHWYGVIPMEIYWENARDMAAGMRIGDMPGYLATVGSQEENDFIFHEIIDTLRNPSILDEYWLGGFDIGRQWTWITGEPWEFVNWSTGEPNNVGVETALAMWGPTTTHPYRIPGKWNNSLPNDEVHELHKFWAVVEFGPRGPVDEVTPTDEWISIYCDSPTIDGQPFPNLGMIRAYDPDGILCGKGAVNRDGSYGFIPIYHDDIYTDIDEGAEPGDLINLTFNSEPVMCEEPLIWTENGDVFERCVFTRESCLEIELHQGWNLISWNVMYEDDIQTALADIVDCVDVILAFNEEGLTFDPDLPDYSTLRSVDYSHGYWFRMSCDATLKVCGPDVNVRCQRCGIPVEPGWNLVSYWPRATLPVETGFGSILDVLQVAVGFDNGALVWHYELDDFNTLTHLSPTFGYWTRVSDRGMIVYPRFTYVDFYNGGIDLLGSKLEPTDCSRTWMSVYGENVLLDGSPLRSGDHIEFTTADGIACGNGHYGNGKLMFVPVYGYDELGEASKEFPSDNDIIQVHVNGERVYPDIQWQGQGSRSMLSALTSESGLPSEFELSQNYPNPFNPATDISFTLPHASRVKLSIYNITGQRVATLVDGYLEAGTYTERWDATDDSGRPVATGVYLYRLEAEGYSEARKMLLVK